MRSQNTETLWKNSRAHTKAVGGFLEITVPQLLMAYWAYLRQHISLKALHVWFAAWELKKTRLNLEDHQTPKFRIREFQTLVGGTERIIKKALRELEAVGLMKCSQSSIEHAISPDQLLVDDLSTFWAMLAKVPASRRDKKLKIPRRLVLLAAGGARKGLIATLIGQFIWCLFNRKINGQYQIVPTGNCKSSWIADVFGLTTRAVEEQRRHLVHLGVLIEEEQEQWHLNRFGRRYSINLRWERPDRAVDNSNPKAVGEGGACVESSTPQAENGTESSTPCLNQHLLSSRELKNPHPPSGRPMEIKKSFKEVKMPTLNLVVDADLHRTSRLFELFDQAVARGWFHQHPHERLLFVSAAEHSRVIGVDNPCACFASMIRNRNDKKWAYITQADEDAAISRIRDYFRPDERRKPAVRPERTVVKVELTEDAKLARAARQIAATKRITDPFRLIKPHHPEWTRERYDRALAELNHADFERSLALNGAGGALTGMSTAEDVLETVGVVGGSR